MEFGTGHKVGEHKFMEGSCDEHRHITQIHCSTGWGSEGHWKFPILKVEDAIAEVEDASA